MLTDKHKLRVVKWCLVGILVCAGVFLFSNDACAQSLGKTATGAIIGANLADLVSTEYAVRHGAVEANPVMGNTTLQRAAMKAGGTAVTVFLLQKLGQKHPTLARVTAYTVSGVLYGVAVHNVRQAR